MKTLFSHIFQRERHPVFFLEFCNIKLKRKSGMKRKRNNQNEIFYFSGLIYKQLQQQKQDEYELNERVVS